MASKPRRPRLAGLALWCSVAFLVVIVAVGSPAAAQGRSFKVTAHDDGYTFWMQFDGIAEKNPTVTLQPGDHVRVDFGNMGTASHNFHIGGSVDRETPCCQKVGSSASVEFDVPSAAGDVPYYCVPHQSLGMGGTFHTASVASNAGSGSTPPAPAKSTPSPFGSPLLVLGALAAVGLLARRKP